MATVCKRIISPEALDCAVIEPNHIVATCYMS